MWPWILWACFCALPSLGAKGWAAWWLGARLVMGRCHEGCPCGATTGEPLGSERPRGVGNACSQKDALWGNGAEIPFPGAELGGAAHLQLPFGHPQPGAVSPCVYPRGSAPPKEGLNPLCIPGRCHGTLSPTPAAARVTLGWSPAGPRACPPGRRGRTGCAVLSGIFTRSDPASQSHSAFNSLSTPNLLLCI